VSIRGLPGPAAAVGAIALNTFREAIRDRVLYLLLAFALVIIGVSRLLALLTVGNDERVIKDVGLSAISLFGVLLAVFVGVSLVYKEIERRTVYTLLAQPVARWHFVSGKFVGLLAVLAANVGLMAAALFVVLALRGVSPWGLLPAVALMLVELAMICAFALLFSSLTNPILAATWTFAVFVAGHLSWSLKLLRPRLNGAGALACDALYWILPDLERLNLKVQAVHGLPLAPAQALLAAGYGLAYAGLVLALACLVFSRRDFT